MTLLDVPVKGRPLWAITRSREEFNNPDLPILTVKSGLGVSIRNLEEGGRAVSEDLSGYRVVKPGDLVVNRLWARFGAYGVSTVEGIISPAYWVLVLDTRMIWPRFLHYVLLSAPYRAEIWRLSKDMPPNGFDIPWEQFRRVHIPLPDKSQQRRIADFLDSETNRIDKVITKKRDLFGLLEERMDSHILQRIAASALVSTDANSSAVPIKRILTKVKRFPLVDNEVVTAAVDRCDHGAVSA